MNRGPTATATIELNLDAQAPDGVLTDGQGETHRFSGWIELAAAIEDWRIATSRAVPDGAGDQACAHQTLETDHQGRKCTG
jgi:hypothetical protein